jgi:hypothetical protein
VHPDDVRDLLIEQVAELNRMLDDRSELGVKGMEHVDTDVFITIGVDHAAAAPVPLEVALELAGEKKLLVAGAGGQIVNQVLFNVPTAVPLLGEKTERDLLLRVGCDGFNGRPPLAELLRPEDRSLLPDAEWPRDPSGQGIVPAHPVYRRKFFCRPGFREFHVLDQHADQPWDRIREQSTLGWLLVPLLADLKTRWKLL